MTQLEKITRNNKNYRKVIETTKQMQLVLMSLSPFQDIGYEVHPKTTQFIRVEQGSCVAQLDGKVYQLKSGDSIMIPAMTRHNIVAQKQGVKLYTIYSPPEHKIGLIQKYKMV